MAWLKKNAEDLLLRFKEICWLEKKKNPISFASWKEQSISFQMLSFLKLVFLFNLKMLNCIHY